MRVLVVSPTPSHPQDAGNRARIHALLSALKAAGHAIHLCLLLRENPSPEALAAMRAAWDEVIAVPHDRARERRSLGDENALDDWILPEAEAAFAELAAREPGFDLVLVEYVFLSRAFEFFPRAIPRVLDTHDIFAGRAARLAALGLENRFFATTEAEENRGLDRADLVLAIQAEEAAALAGRTRAVVMTLGHLPWDDRPPLAPRAAEGPVALGYLGSPNPLNTRALGRFLAALDPAGLAGGEVVVAGGAARGLSAGPGLRPIGPVADADALYAQADIVVNPHEGGTGLKIKTVEALTRGLPVIGTAEAFAGLPAESPFHAAADAMELAAIARACVEDPALRETVARDSARLAARYAAEVRAARAVLASPAALARLLDRPRLLLVTDIPFWLARLGNHQRIAAIAEAARLEMDLDLFFAAPLDDSEREAAQRLVGPRGRIFAADPGPDAAEPPWGLTQFERSRFDGAVFAALAAHLQRHPPHAMLIEYLRLSYLRLAVGWPAPLTALDTHDVMSLRMQNFRHFGREHFIRISTSEELKILDAFNLVLAIQGEEWAWLEKLLPGRVLLAPHALPALPRARGSGSARPRIGFLGGDSPMNRDGLLWLLAQVWPAVVGAGAELHIAGGVCEAVPPGREGVVLHGEVADQHAFLAGLDIAVNPVFFGGGLKIKTVEYLAHGLPSVLTAEALLGMAGGAGTAYVLAQDREAFVAGLVALVRDEAMRARMGTAAQAFARRHFGPRALDPAMRAMAGLARGITRPEPGAVMA